MAGCIDRVLAAEYAKGDEPESNPEFPNDGVLTKVVRFLLPAVRGLPAAEVIRITNAASGCMGFRKPIRPKAAWIYLITTIVGLGSLFIIDKFIQDSVSPELRMLVSWVGIALLLAVNAAVYFGELNYHAERIIADEASGVDAMPEDE
jgi:branched-subunit amino acid permease